MSPNGGDIFQRKIPMSKELNAILNHMRLATKLIAVGEYEASLRQSETASAKIRVELAKKTPK